MDNIAGAVDVPCSLFSGLNTELTPSDVPEGVSPDCQDVAFVPGSFQQRPGLTKLFSGGSFVYEKTYIQPNGMPLNLFLDTNGVLWKEDVFNSPGALSQIGQVAPGSYCQSVTAFGREYMAFSDGFHGSDIPRQFDGANFDRVSQDGPGAGPTLIQDFSQIVSVASGSGVTSTAAISAISEVGSVVTVTTSTPHGFSQGQVVSVFGVSVAGYNGIQTVQTINSATVFTYTLTATGLGSSAAGSVGAATCLINTATAHGMNAGDSFILAGTSVFDNNVGGNPASWTITQVTTATQFLFSLVGAPSTAFASTPINFSVGTVTTGGMISPGTHQVVVMFLTRQGYLTAPSAPVSWVSAGGKQVQITGIPIGPANVVARVFGFTGTGGDNFFSIIDPVSIPTSTGVPIVVPSTVVNDNTSTSAIIDFSDNALFGATAIDIPGNNLFAQVVLGPCLGFFGYASRLIPWGEYNKVQSFVNMGFDGGYQAASPTVPLGWTVATSGGKLVSGEFGQGWQITGDGTGSQKGMITQTAYHNYLGNAILQPLTTYNFRCWAKRLLGNTTGSIVAEIYSPSSGVISSATIPLVNVGLIGSFVQANFIAQTPAVIPSDTLVRFYTISTVSGQLVTLDELEMVFAQNPYFLQARASYSLNPEAFDGETGVLGPDDDTTDIKNLTILRSNLLFKTAQGIHVTQDNAGSEPSGWTFNEITRTVGSVSFRASDAGRFGTGDSGEEWDITASRGGLYIYAGGEVLKISQEIQSDWETINWSAAHTLWIKNDSISRRVYIGVPTGTNTSPNKILVMDYRYLESASQIAQSGCVRISYTGKMIATDMCRKWTRWSIPALCGEILNRPNNTLQMCVGTSRNVYYFDPSKLSDDDYGQIPASYTTYAFVNGELEQALQLGGHRKLFVYLTLNCSGGGFVKVTPLANTLTNPRQVKGPYPVFANPDHDLEIPLNVATERVFLRFDPQPPASSTDINFQLTKIVLSCKPHPWSVIRGAI